MSDYHALSITMTPGNNGKLEESSFRNGEAKKINIKAMKFEKNPVSKVTRMIGGKKTKIEPDRSIDRAEYIKQYSKNPDLWNKAFEFLANADLENMAPGRYEIAGSDLYASVDAYKTKDIETARFEAHRKYADIQYLISGEERIGIIRFDQTEITDPYNDTRDVMFLKATQGNFNLATPLNFFVFFPEDAHCPGVCVTEPATVKKVVLKVRIQ
jgi:YhcH/YjgK/YiaL family protein